MLVLKQKLETKRSPPLRSNINEFRKPRGGQETAKLEQEQVVWEAVQEFTNGDPNTTFAPADIDKAVENRYSDFPVYISIRR